MPPQTILSRSLKCLIVITIYIQICCTFQLSVCTYNLWNVMFSWEIRMRHIANMVDKAGCQVLMLQEVRFHGDRSGSQAVLLQQLMPRFQWMASGVADKVSKPLLSYWAGWEMEGLAVISKFPLGEKWIERLSRAHGPDTNQRIALHVPVMVDAMTTVNVVVVHLSYHRQQQCQNAAEILKSVHPKKLTVVAGDFNTYTDFPDPIHLFIHKESSQLHQDNKCSARTLAPQNAAAFHDAWETTHGNVSGFTFSNMPEPGLISRPDRILASYNFKVLQTWTVGHENDYRAKFQTAIILHRLRRVVQAARDSVDGNTGYSCLHDCGPHGSCRCGLCVRREDQQGCLLPDCQECSTSVFWQLCAFFLLLCFLLSMTALAAVKILVIASYIDQSGVFVCRTFGWSCCLCNVQLVRQPTVSGRHGLGKLLRCLRVGRLPPVHLFIASLTSLVVCLLLSSWLFKPTLRTVYSVMSEEYFPSDHLMLVAKLQVK